MIPRNVPTTRETPKNIKIFEKKYDNRSIKKIFSMNGFTQNKTGYDKIIVINEAITP